MNIKKFTGEITQITDLSKTAKEVSIKLNEPISFLSGSFVNVFVDVNGEKVRRAYSISSPSSLEDSITLSIRLSPTGTVTPLFWSKDMIGSILELMGPMGLNTVDKMHHDKVYLFAFGIGVGVVKSITDYFANIQPVKHLTIYTGSRNEDEIIYKDYFDNLSKSKDNISVKYIVSDPNVNSPFPKGYIQDFIGDLDFNNSDVYVCGQEKACSDLVSKVNSMNPQDCSFFIEAFH
ncbi:MAG: FAD-dependent oxidoreductase [Candidatus Paceibacterota bacterium]|jgi:NAD(P)H-flavin reductase